MLEYLYILNKELLYINKQKVININCFIIIYNVDNFIYMWIIVY